MQKIAGWGLLHGDKIEVLAQTGSGVAGKHRQGGQSAKRFQKLREMELTYYFNRVAETTREYFIDIYPIKGLNRVRSWTYKRRFYQWQLS